MPTESPVRDMMIEILTNEAVGLPVVRAAGEVVVDAAANIRMVDAQGHTNIATTMEAMKRYKDQMASAQQAWAAFKEETARAGPFDVTANQRLERALIAVKQGLDRIADESSLP